MQSLSSRYKTKLPQVALAVLLGLVLLVENVVSMLSVVRHIQQSAVVLPLYAITLSTILALWVHYDSRAINMSMGIDQAMYVFFAWPITFPYYALRSRGFRSGSLLLLSFVGIFLLTLIAAVIISFGIGIGWAVLSAGK